jgi:hypothetical protein
MPFHPVKLYFARDELVIFFGSIKNPTVKESRLGRERCLIGAILPGAKRIQLTFYPLRIIISENIKPAPKMKWVLCYCFTSLIFCTCFFIPALKITSFIPWTLKVLKKIFQPGELLPGLFSKSCTLPKVNGVKNIIESKHSKMFGTRKM